MNTIGERIKDIRNSLELTGEEFGAKLNVKKGTVSNWENNNRIPDALMLVRIAEELNLLTKLRDEDLTINDNDLEILSRIKMIGLKV
jgi:transcriptional regulator with XRE-family HTH domain